MATSLNPSGGALKRRPLPGSDRGYNVLAVLMYSLLIDAMARSAFLGEAPWDLLLLVMLAGGASAVDPRRHVLPRSWFALGVVALITFLSAFVIAALVAFVRP